MLHYKKRCYHMVVVDLKKTSVDTVVKGVLIDHVLDPGRELDLDHVDDHHSHTALLNLRIHNQVTNHHADHLGVDHVHVVVHVVVNVVYRVDVVLAAAMAKK